MKTLRGFIWVSVLVLGAALLMAPGPPAGVGPIADHDANLAAHDTNIVSQLGALSTALGNLLIPAPVAQTGQTMFFEAGDDADVGAGVQFPDPRFADNGDGTVTDNLTRLIWLKDWNCLGNVTWTNALTAVNSLEDGSPAACNLSDGSQAGDYHLPNRVELLSVLSLGNTDPPLPTGHPFDDVVQTTYWSSTLSADNSAFAWVVSFADGGSVNGSPRTSSNQVLAVRSP